MIEKKNTINYQRLSQKKLNAPVPCLMKILRLYLHNQERKDVDRKKNPNDLSRLHTHQKKKPQTNS